MDNHFASVKAHMDQRFTDLEDLMKFGMSVRLANSSRAPMAPLHNPSAAAATEGFPPLLEPPNPQTRDELMSFSSESSILSWYMYAHFL